MSALRRLRQDKRANLVLAVTAVVAVALLPMFRPPLDGFVDDCILALAYGVFAYIVLLMPEYADEFS